MDRTLSLSVKFAAFDKLTGPLRRMAGGARAANRDLAATRKEVLDLEKSTAKLASFRKAQAAIAATNTEMDEARRKLRNLRLEMEQADGPTGRLQQRIAATERRLERLGSRAETESGRVKELGQHLRDAGVDTGRLADEQDRLARRLEAVNGKLAEQKERADKVAARAARRERIAQGGEKLQALGGKSLAVGAAVGLPLVAATRAAMSYEDAMADVKKVVSGTPAELARLDRGILNLSRRLPTAADGIAAIVAAGGQSGIARGELLQFAETATKMGIAFDLTADQAGEMMANWRSAFGMGQRDVTTLADKVNYLGNTAGARASAISDIVTRIGPLGAVGGLASGEIAALGATLASMGIESEVAATGIKNTMLALTKGLAATKDQKAALKGLGLESVTLAKRMQKDAAGTIMDVMRRIGRLPKAQQAGLMTDLFGSESIAAIAPMLTQLPALARNFDRVGDAAKFGGSMNAEYAARAATTSNRVQLLENRTFALKKVLGDQLLPVVSSGAEWMGGLADRFSAFAETHPRVARGLVMVATGLALGATGLGALALGLGITGPAMVRGFGMILSAGKGLLNFLKLGRAAAWAFNLAMGANPWVLAIAGLVALAFAIYTHWGSIKRFLSGMVAWFRNIGGNLIDGLSAGVSARWDSFKAKIMSLGQAAPGWLKRVLGIRSPSRVFAELGGHMMGGLALGVDRGVRMPLARVQAAGRNLTRAAALTVTAAAPAGAAPPGAGPAAQGAAVSIGEVHIHVHQQPGEDGGALAQRIAAEVAKLRRGEAAARASGYRDDE